MQAGRLKTAASVANPRWPAASPIQRPARPPCTNTFRLYDKSMAKNQNKRRPVKPRIGRPPKPTADLRELRMQIRVSRAELDAIEAAGQPNPSTWARGILLAAAAKHVGK
jgi:hypothetical protein